MTRPIGPDGLPPKASPHALHLATDGADGPRRTVSILRDLSPGQVRLDPAPAARTGSWKWMLPPVLAALVGGAFLLGRQAPGPTPPAPGPAAPLADARPAPPGVAEPPLMPAAPGGAGGGAIIREPSPPPSTPGTPETTPRAAESVGAPARGGLARGWWGCPFGGLRGGMPRMALAGGLRRGWGCRSCRWRVGQGLGRGADAFCCARGGLRRAGGGRWR